MADDTLRARLERAAEGLVYTSEGDAPFEWVELGTADASTPDAFRALVHGAPGARVQEVTLERFFAGHIEGSDPTDTVAQSFRARYQALRDTLREALPDVRVFRVGEVEIRCYLVGHAPDGTLAGLATTAWET